MSPSPTAWMPAPVNLERPPSSKAWMQVLVKDLCNPDVVATIAKRRFFDITDRPNLTPEIWEKFRNMLSSVQCSQPVDPVDLKARLGDCRPRLSQSPNPEEAGYPVEGCDTPGLSFEESLEESKIEAKEAYDTLIQMGGRPTRPIRFNPRWKKVLVHGELCYDDFEEIEVLFYDTYSKPTGCLWLTEAEFIAGHWGGEREQFEEELRRWQDFLDTQRWRREHRPEFAREEDMEQQRYPHDPHLTASLKKLKDWKEYQIYFQRRIDRCKKRMEWARRAEEAIERKDPEVVWSIYGTGTFRGRDNKDWRGIIERQLEIIAAEEKRLEWVKKQLPVVLSECAASLMEMPASRREMELRSELETKQVYNTLMETGGRPSRPMQPVPDIYNIEHTDKHVHTLCHWEGECSQFEEELREWKKFLDYRQKKEMDRRTEVQLEEQQSAASPTQVDLWKDYRAYQQLEVENAKQWVEFWQRQAKDCQEIENRCARQGNGATARRYHSIGEDMKSHVEDTRKQVWPAEMRLEWVEQQLPALLAEHASSTTEMSASDPLEDQAKLLKRTSRLSQARLKDLRSNRSDELALQSNDEKKKIRASTTSALDPIHPSRVSKTAGKKAPRRGRQSKILAKHGDGQHQGPNTTTTSPLLPANVAPRRSSRLSNNEKRSSALEASLAVNLDNGARSPPIVPRRSDRISKQKERMRTSFLIQL